MPGDASKSIEVVEGDRWGEPPTNASKLVKRSYALRKIPLGELEIDDLRLLLRQGIGVDVVLPRAIDVLQSDLLAEGDFYPGDLLESVLNVSDEYWSSHPELKSRLRKLLRDQKGELDARRLSEEIRRDLDSSMNRFLNEGS